MADTFFPGIFITSDPVADTAANAKLDGQVRTFLDSGNLAEIEELFLTRLETSPRDFSFFVPIIRHFVRNKNTDTAETLLQFLLESMPEDSGNGTKLSLVRALLSIWPGSRQIRELAIGTIKTAYSRCRSIGLLMEHFKVLEASDPLDSLKKLESWLRYDVGQGVYMATKGVGSVAEINLSFNAIRVTFMGAPALVSFKPDEADRLLIPLAPGHLLLDVLERTDEIRELLKTDSGELLRRLFSSMGRQLSLSEIKELLSTVIPAQQWNAWWAQAKQDRRLTLSAGNSCSWNDSADDADAALLKEFADAAPRDQLTMAKKFGKRSTVLTENMIIALAETASRITPDDPGLALEAYLTIEKVGGKGNRFSDGIAALIRQGDPLLLVSGIEDRTLRKKTLGVIKETHADWAAIFLSLLKTESDPSALSYLYDALSGDDHKELLDDLVSEVLSAPVKTPNFFVWLCKSMTERKELGRFLTWSLVQTVMQLLAKDAIKQHNPTLRKLFDENGLIDTIARKLDAPVATLFLTLLERDRSLEEYRRERLIKELKAFLIPASAEDDKLFYVTASSLAERQAEFMRITTVDIPQNTEEIVKARAHGDLRENFEYHAARARQEMLSSRAKTLHDELQFARPIDPAKIDPSTICIGTTVLLSHQESKEELKVTVLGPWDSNPEKNIFSYQARIARGLLGKKTGDTAEFHEKQYQIGPIAIWETKPS
jgi:transcription elongation factor GreA